MLTTAGVSAQLTRSGVVTVEPLATQTGGLLLRLAFFDATATVVADFNDECVAFVGVLPPGRGVGRLTRQSSGNVIDRLREQKIGEASVDDAFIVFIDDDGFALLSQCKEELAALTKRGVHKDARISFDNDAVRIHWPGDDLAELPALWEKLVSLRMGG